MENLKIRVNNEAESKEAQELFFELGYRWLGSGFKYMDNRIGLIYTTRMHDMDIITLDRDCVSAMLNHKEITLPELRDLVVLKRNNPKDANYIRPRDGKLYFVNSNKTRSYYMMDDEWTLTKWDEDQLQQQLKPIEKPMKEYLRKNSNGTYSYIGTVRPEHVSDFMIEIPDGATKLVSHNYVHLPIIFVKPCANGYSYYHPSGIWSDTILSDIKGRDIFWSRYTLPEELPFIDDEPLQSLNDQYAEIEKVRQSAWQKQEGGSHYKNLKIQPMQYALENKLDYAQANVVKYVTRHKEKNGKEDLLKAIHNIELMIEFYYGGGE